MKVELTSAPAVEPISTAEAKLFLRVDHTTDDTLIASLIKAARRSCELFQNRVYITQTWKLYLDEFPEKEIRLPFSPVQSVSSVTYVDADGDTQTLSASTYQVDAKGVKPSIYLAPDTLTWPTTQTDKINAVTVTFVAGYGAAGSDVPEHIRAAIQLVLGDLYQNRENTVIGNITNELPNGAKHLLWQDRLYKF